MTVLRVANDDNIIKENMMVVLYEGFTSKKPVVIKAGGKTQTKAGMWVHDELIGKRFGTSIVIKKNYRGESLESVGYVLRPTPEIWTECLQHRTQILYACDIAVIVARLGLRPGKVVVEAGTGSGSLSHSLARAVAPTGKLLTFEFHEERCKEATKEFEQNGLSGVVVPTHRDVCKEYTDGADDSSWGFGLPPSTADAVFLDVPSPWLATRAVHHTLKVAGVFCNFSPCIEQTQRVCQNLRDLNFHDIRTHEVLRREYRAYPHGFRDLYEEKGKKRERDDDESSERMFAPAGLSKGHTAYLTFATKSPFPGAK